MPKRARIKSFLKKIKGKKKRVRVKGHMSLTKAEERRVDIFFDWATKQGKIRGKPLTLKEGLKEYKQIRGKAPVKRNKVVKRKK